jgi:hypothetical protein
VRGRWVKEQGDGCGRVLAVVAQAGVDLPDTRAARDWGGVPQQGHILDVGQTILDTPQEMRNERASEWIRCEAEEGGQTWHHPVDGERIAG